VTGFSATRAAVWSLSWALGVALGVALGAYLSVIGSAAAPGAQSLGSTDLVVLPLVCGLAVFALSFLGRFVAAVLRRTPAGERDEGSRDDHERENEHVGGVQ
jgi:Na+/serine symporter